MTRIHKVDYDVVIVGAGPSGCAAAYDIVSQKNSVLLLDKTEFPRVKACAGALTIKAIKALRYSVRPIVRRVCFDLIVGKGFGVTRRFRSRHPISAMTLRSEFDEFCLQQTLAAGGAFRLIRTISEIHQHHSHVEIVTEQGSIKARFLIGADGARSGVKKLTGEFIEGHLGMALEAKIPGRFQPDMAIDFGAVPHGYGWRFPKDDHVNVGIYTNSPDVRLHRRQLTKYALAKAHTETMECVSGQVVGLGGWKYRPRCARVFLVGDAAGMVDPLLGEGIYNAIRSGQIAAEAVCQELNHGTSGLAVFRHNLRGLQQDLLSGIRSAGWFYKYPGFGFWALTFPVTRYALMRSYALGLTFSQARRIYALPFKSIKPGLAEK